jgi:SAM-dependent methyltransferase
VRQEEKTRIIELYDGRLKELGYNIRTVGWSDRESQWLRFKVLCEIGNLNGASICDVGCGFGDLLDYLKENQIKTFYTGVDISPGLLVEAARLHLEVEFVCRDLVTEPWEREFDYLLLSGALSYRIADNWDYTCKMIRSMYAMAKRGIALNFLTKYVNYQNPINYHYSPEEMFAFARTLSKRVTLRHDYPLWEFTIYLYKEP